MAKGPQFIGRTFYSLTDWPTFDTHLKGMFSVMTESSGKFAGDNLITWGKSLAWTADKEFVTAFDAHAKDAAERTILWRSVTLAWAVRQALRVEGDFVECGCYQGTTARILYDVAKLADSDRRFFLYDLFDNAEGVAKHAMPNHSVDLEAFVRQRFADLPNVIVTQGSVPESLSQASPEKIAFMHIDMNNMEAEIGALDALFDRVATGGVIILDDYGWIAYAKQMRAERSWFAERGYHVLELPTGQGMVIR